MQLLNCRRIRLLLVGLVAALVIGDGPAKADFTFGEPTNLGPNINTSVEDGGISFSPDGLELYLSSFLDGFGLGTFRRATRETTEDPWGEAIGLVPPFKRTVGSCISADGLELYFDSDRVGGSGGADIWMATRVSTSDPWENPVNLGTSLNSNDWELGPSISADGLELYFGSSRGGGSGDWDIWVCTRATAADPWGTAVNLGPTVNSSVYDGQPFISANGLMLFMTSNRTGGYGDWDIWMARRSTKEGDWSKPINLGPMLNSEAGEAEPFISSDEKTLYFSDWWIPRDGGYGINDVWQAPILPVVDFNGDAIVDVKDVLILTEHWGQDYPLCDIGPTPLGDGIVDVQDLTVLTEYIEPIDRTLIAHWALDEMEGDIAQDSAGSDDDAIVIGNPVWRPDAGKVGGALRFDGADDYISTPFILNPREVSFSVTAWILGGVPGQVIISQADADEQGPVESGSTWLGLSPSDGRLMTGLMDIFFGPLESELALADGQWHHVALVYDRTAMKRHLYVDGAEVTVDTYSVGGVESTAGLYIGAGQTLDAGTFFSGLIDDVRIYNVALNPEKIEVLAQ